MKQFYAFGEPVPQEIIDTIIADGTPEEEITTEFLETYLWYDHQDAC